MKLHSLTHIFLIAILASAYPAWADDPTYYARALMSLPKGTTLSKSNIVVIASDGDHIPSDALWLPGKADLFGFALLKPVAKGSVISGDDMYTSASNDRDLKPGEPTWKQYAKSAIICDKQNDYEKSWRYEEGALVDLTKMTKDRRRIVHPEDEALLTQENAGRH